MVIVVSKKLCCNSCCVLNLYMLIGQLQSELSLVRSSLNDKESVPQVNIEPVQKKARFSLFNYSAGATDCKPKTSEVQLTHYLDIINSPSFDGATVSELLARHDFALLTPLFERLFCVPASSAPVERVFSQSGLLLRPNRARMSDRMLEDLVFMKCNNKKF